MHSSKYIAEWPGFKPLLFFILLLCAVADAYAGPEGRSRSFCLGTYSYPCGGHLEPQCTSGSICDAGFNSYTIDVDIQCPSIFIPDETVTAGCYDERPSCDDCSADGQIPCPPEAEPFCTAGCDAGLISHPTTTICSLPGSSGIPPGNIGAPCLAGSDCKRGLDCDQLLLKCTAKSKVGEACDIFLSCEDDLTCSWGRCANVPAQVGQTCDVSKPCADGLYCQTGIPQRCKPLRKVGEACSVFNPCVTGASCQVCTGEGCNASLQCFPEGDSGIDEDYCLSLRSPGLHNQIQNDGASIAHTFSVGNSAAAGIGESQEFGVMYGDNGRYGCFVSMCAGLNIDLGIEHYVSTGIANSPDDVAGSSWISFEEAQLVNVLNYAAVQVWPRRPGELVPSGGLIGTNAVLAVGTPTNPYPLSGGAFVCETTLEEFPIPDDNDEIVVIPVPGPTGSPPDGGSSPEYGALRFNGEANNKVALSSTTALNALTFDTAMSISAWLSPAGTAQSASFLSKEGEYQIGLRDGELAYTIANTSPGWSWVNTGFVPPVDQWTHITLTYDSTQSSSNMRFYVNGQLQHERDGSGIIGDRHPQENEFHIGGRQNTGNAETYAGIVDEVRVWSRALSDDEVHANLLDAEEASLANALVADWRFEESTGLLLGSETGSDYTIRLDSADALSPPVRVAGTRLSAESAIYFNGTDSHVGVMADTFHQALQNSDTFTVEAWLKPTGTGAGTGASIFYKAGEFSLNRKSDGEISFTLATAAPGAGEFFTGVQLPEDTWSHVAFVYDSAGGTLTLYLDGEALYSDSASGLIMDTDPTENDFLIGQGFDGYVDEVRIWDVARSAAQIESTYAAPLSQPDTLPLLAYWRFNENSLALAVDHSSQRHTAYFGSGQTWQWPIAMNMMADPDFPATLITDPCSVNPMPDKDNDTVCDAIDNCPLVENLDQADANNDGLGDACTVVTVEPVVAPTALPVANQSVNTGATNVVLQRFTLNSNYASSSLNAITLNGTGSGNEAESIQSIRLWIDVNADGVVDAGDQQIGSGTFLNDNDALTITLNTVYVLPYGNTEFIVTADFN